MWSFSLLYRNFLVSCNPIFQSFLLVAELLEFYLGSHCLCLYSPVYCLFSCCSFKVSGCILRFLSTFSWYLCRVKDRDLVSVFYMKISSFPSTICWRGCLFFIAYFGLLCQKSGECSSANLCLGCLFFSVGLCVCFCASIMLLLLLWLCSTSLP
jgi:hypothetical protein